MKTVRLKEVSTAFASRWRARQYRHEVERSEAPVCFDFEGVLIITNGFADELFGVLARDRGLDWFSEHVAFKDVAREVRETVLRAIDRRLPPGAVI